MDKLKPCPFCGVVNVRLIGGKDKFDRVQCMFCGATGPWYDGHPEVAVSGWNRRVSLPDICDCKNGGQQGTEII